jgi:DNA polymerase III epsilon subunit-like protein
LADRPLHLIGLDFETSGSDHERSAPIQIGIATVDGEVYSSLVGGWKWSGPVGPRRFDWSSEAQQVHGIEKSDLATARDRTAVDREASDWVRERFPGAKPSTLITVGWNVAGFDHPFLRKHFKRTAGRLSYRSVDLNAVVFAITQAGLPGPTGEPWKYDRLKRRVKDAAAHRANEFFGSTKWHDAGYDALASLYAFDELKAVLRPSFVSGQELTI